MDDEKLLDISWAAILKIAFAIFFFYLLYQVKEILILIIFAFIISLLFNPAINFLERKKVPRILSALFVYLLVFGLISLFFYLIVNSFVLEIQKFLEFLPQYFEKISPTLRELGFQTFENFETLITELAKNLGKMGTHLFNALFVIFGGISSAIFVLVLAIFFSLEEAGFGEIFSLFFPKKYEESILEIWEDCQKKISGWFGTRIIACGVVGLLSYFAFFLFDVKYSFTLAFLAGILNFIPILGPIFTGAIILLLISFDSLNKAILSLIAFILIQQIEGNILTPILTKRFLSLSPSLVLISLVIGGKLAGILGAILAVPLTGILFEFLKGFFAKKREEEAVVL
jgi:predicted PurR-regulated permease PerM